MRCSLIIIALMTLIASTASAKVLGTVGQTYAISEIDALSEIEGRARSVDWKQLYSKVHPETYRPQNLTYLPRAQKTKSFLVDMTYKLDTDIPDGKGGILYPAGYKFNPLDYVPFQKVLVVIDGNDQEQITWFAHSKYKGRPEVTLLITDGISTQIQKQIRRPVFYASEPILQRFKLKAVPAVVQKKEKFMEVQEIALPYSKSQSSSAKALPKD